jgi:hypothetical protein
MTEPSLPELEAEREQLFDRLIGIGDIRRGSVSPNYRKCGKPNCKCAEPGHPGHGPRYLWTRSEPGRRGTVGRQLKPAEVEKVRQEIARFAVFRDTVEQIEQVSEQICEARPVLPQPDGQAPDPGGQKGGSGSSWSERSPPS